MIGRLVEQHQIGPPPHQQRQRQARFLAAGKRRDRRIGHAAAEVEAAEVIAQQLFLGPRFLMDQVPQR